jgi:hypothetical protein
VPEPEPVDRVQRQSQRQRQRTDPTRPQFPDTVPISSHRHGPELNAKAQRRKGAKLALRSSEAAWRGRCPRRIGSKHHRSASASMVGFKPLLVPLRGTPASGLHAKLQTPHLFERAPARKRQPTAQSVTSLAIRSETGGPRSGPGGTAIRGARCLYRASGTPLHPSGCTPLEPVSLASKPSLRLCVFAPLRFVLPPRTKRRH